MTEELVVLEELRALKEFYMDTGIGNPVWPLLLPLLFGIAASHILWAVYIFWVEQPILVNVTHLKEEEEAFYAVVEESVVEEPKIDESNVATVRKDIENKTSIEKPDDPGKNMKMNMKKDYTMKYQSQDDKTVTKSAPVGYGAHIPIVVLAKLGHSTPGIRRNLGKSKSIASESTSIRTRASAPASSVRKKRHKKSKKSIKIRLDSTVKQ